MALSPEEIAQYEARGEQAPGTTAAINQTLAQSGGWDLLTQGDPAAVHGTVDLTRYETYTLELQLSAPLPGGLTDVLNTVATAVSRLLPSTKVGVWANGNSLYVGITTR